MSGEIVNQKGRLNAASEILEMLGCPAPHSEEECHDCGHTWALDADDPDYEEIELCSKCHGKGVLAFGGQTFSCTLCDGRGSL